MHPFYFTLIITMDQQLNVSVSIVHIFTVYSSDATCSLKAMSIEKCSLSVYPSYCIIELFPCFEMKCSCIDICNHVCVLFIE